MSGRLRLGLIGSGGVTVQHLPVLARLGRTELVGVVCRTVERAAPAIGRQPAIGMPPAIGRQSAIGAAVQPGRRSVHFDRARPTREDR